jgi:hypothetical protein
MYKKKKAEKERLAREQAERDRQAEMGQTQDPYIADEHVPYEGAAAANADGGNGAADDYYNGHPGGEGDQHEIERMEDIAEEPEHHHGGGHGGLMGKLQQQAAKYVEQKR